LRILYYTYDYCGIDHLRRALALAEQVAFECPEATQLLVSGIPQPRNTKLPFKLDMIKLPTMDLPFKGRDYGSTCMSTPLLREAIILNALRHFEPDVIFMEEASGEAQREMVKALTQLKLDHSEMKFVIRLYKIEEDTSTSLRSLLSSRNSISLPSTLRAARSYASEDYGIARKDSKRHSVVTSKN